MKAAQKAIFLEQFSFYKKAENMQVSFHFLLILGFFTFINHTAKNSFFDCKINRIKSDPIIASLLLNSTPS